MNRLNFISYKIVSSKNHMIKIPFAEGEATFNKLVKDKTKCIVLFTGEPRQDGTNWCPDCEVIAPLYSKFQEECKANNLPFYVFIAGDRPTWKNPENFLRVNKAIKINNVPTMGYFDGSKVVNKLSGDEEIGKADQRALLFE